MFKRVWGRLLSKKNKASWIEDPNSLGRLLLEHRHVTMEQLAMAHSLATTERFRIGEALIQHPDVRLRRDVVDDMLMVQSARKRGNTAEIIDFGIRHAEKTAEVHRRFQAALGACVMPEEETS